MHFTRRLQFNGWFKLFLSLTIVFVLTLSSIEKFDFVTFLQESKSKTHVDSVSASMREQTSYLPFSSLSLLFSSIPHFEH